MPWHARHGKGPLQVLRLLGFFSRQRPKYRQGRAPSGILQLANLGVGHRMRRRNQRHTCSSNNNNDNNNDMARHEYPGHMALGGWRGARRQGSHLGGPHGISASHRAL